MLLFIFVIFCLFIVTQSFKIDANNATQNYIISKRILKDERIYNEGDQFPKGNFELPLILTYAIYMGKINYKYIEFTIESMRSNPQVTYVLINIIKDNSNDSHDIDLLTKKLNVLNFKLKIVTITEFTTRVKKYLNLDVKFTTEWYYKMCDYKPTLAVLFPEFFNEKNYLYWGYNDMDVIWGSFNSFAHLFQGNYTFIISGWWHSTGAAAWYKNTDESKNLFRESEKYLNLLTDINYHNLDEAGMQVTPKNVVDNGRHSINHLQEVSVVKNNYKRNIGKVPLDHCFADAEDCRTFAGPVLWSPNGKLTIVKGSDVFPPGRELLFFHRPDKEFNFNDKLINNGLFKDMINYGYLLPAWVPLASRFMHKHEGNIIKHENLFEKEVQ